MTISGQIPQGMSCCSHLIETLRHRRELVTGRLAISRLVVERLDLWLHVRRIFGGVVEGEPEQSRDPEGGDC